MLFKQAGSVHILDQWITRAVGACVREAGLNLFQQLYGARRKKIVLAVGRNLELRQERVHRVFRDKAIQVRLRLIETIRRKAPPARSADFDDFRDAGLARVFDKIVRCKVHAGSSGLTRRIRPGRKGFGFRPRSYAVLKSLFGG
ncbi:hypothetical protein [Pseudaestuariivita sp.]|uniref:hypothetical protein n=1 Tax=Pseudaestuariivita sp. TaxID=2211669 RepID=UPI004057F548